MIFKNCIYFRGICNISPINQHKMTITFYKCAVSLSNINKCHFKIKM